MLKSHSSIAEHAFCFACSVDSSLLALPGTCLLSPMWQPLSCNYCFSLDLVICQRQLGCLWV